MSSDKLVNVGFCALSKNLSKLSKSLLKFGAY